MPILITLVVLFLVNGRWRPSNLSAMKLHFYLNVVWWVLLMAAMAIEIHFKYYENDVSKARRPKVSIHR